METIVWSELAGAKIDKIDWSDRSTKLTLYTDKGTFNVTSSEFNYGVSFYAPPFDPADPEVIRPETLEGKRIVRLVVPFLAHEYRDDALIHVVFDDGVKVCLGAEDFVVALAIKRIDP
jgi:hypothetical protein